MAQSVKTLSVFLNLKSKAFSKGLNKMGKNLQKFGGQMKSVGANMTKAITIPIAAMGVASAKSAMDFETSMTKIQTLVGVSAGEVAKLKEEVKDLAGTTAQSPVELADGLYFLTSAGLDSAEAMEALEAVSKGVAVGLGEQGDLAKVAAAATNAYGSDVVSASDALDMFGTMVRTGMFESAELANVLGEQLGLAANLGISMEELGAMVSTYTRTTGSATAATTGLSGIMMSFAKITKQQEEALDSVGLSVEDVRTSLGDKGLQHTLLMLQDRFKENNVDLSKFFSKSQALKGVLGVLGNQTESYTDVLDSMKDSQGFVNDAFDVTAETAGHKFKQVLADLQVVAIELGTHLLPIVVDITRFVSDLAKRFTSMTGDTQKGIMGVLGGLGAIGPAIFLLGTAITTLGGIITGVTTIVGALQTALAAVGWPVIAVFAVMMVQIAAVGAILGLVAYNIYKDWDTVKATLVGVINYFIDLYNESQFFKYAIETIKLTINALWISAQRDFGNLKALLSLLGTLATNMFDPAAQKKAIKDYFNNIETNADNAAEKMIEAGQTFKENIESRDPIEFITAEDIDKGIDAVGDFATNAANTVVDKMKNVGGQIAGYLGFGGGGGTGETDEGDTGTTATPEIDEYFEEGRRQHEEGMKKLFSDQANEPLFKWSETVKESFSSTFESLQDNLKNFALDYSMAFSDMIATTITEGGNLAENFANFVVDMVKQLAQLIIKMIVFKTLMKALGMPVGVAGGGGGGGFLGGLFGMAEGGLATGPTPILVGEGRGTSISNPEVIAPLDKLQNMIGGMGGGRLHGSISGSNILLSNQRGLTAQDRVSGSVTDF